MEYKILITGTMGAGKTTALEQISETPPVSTDVTNTRIDQSNKARTTVALDYGELALGDGDVLRIYGSPGQERFSFMLPVLAKGALGIVYLVDFTRPEPLKDLEWFLDSCSQNGAHVPSVVALNKVPEDEADAIDTFQEYLQSRNLPWPAITADIRNRHEVLNIVEIILSLSEVRYSEGAQAR